MKVQSNSKVYFRYCEKCHHNQLFILVGYARKTTKGRLLPIYLCSGCGFERLCNNTWFYGCPEFLRRLELIK